MATPAIGSAVASLLKTVPGVGTIAGGVLQGLVQALVFMLLTAVFTLLICQHEERLAPAQVE